MPSLNLGMILFWILIALKTLPQRSLSFTRKVLLIKKELFSLQFATLITVGDTGKSIKGESTLKDAQQVAK